MTLDKSDAQLDAEAAGPPPDLEAIIKDHRAAYRAELRIPLTTSRVPSDLEDVAEHVKVDGEWVPTGKSTAYLDAGELGGPSLSTQMVGRLTEPPRGAPWQAGLFALANNCRQRHPDHVIAGGTSVRWGLCWHLVYAAVVAEQPTARVVAANDRFPDPARTTRTLATALQYITDHIDQRHKWELDRQTREDQRVQQVGSGQRTWEHHSVPGLHQEECPQCRKSRAA